MLFETPATVRAQHGSMYQTVLTPAANATSMLALNTERPVNTARRRTRTSARVVNNRHTATDCGARTRHGDTVNRPVSAPRLRAASLSDSLFIYSVDIRTCQSAQRPADVTMETPRI